MKKATNSAARGSASLDADVVMAELSDFDLAIEPVDQRPALRIELRPVQCPDLRQIVLTLGERFGNRAFELDLRVGRDNVEGWLQHLFLDGSGEVQIDVLNRELGLRRAGNDVQA